MLQHLLSGGATGLLQTAVRSCIDQVDAVSLRKDMDMKYRTVLSAAVLLLPLAACAPAQQPADTAADAAGTVAAISPQAMFWANLEQHCGNAYPGRLTLERPGDDMLTGSEQLIVHFRQCGADTLRVPFHIEKEATNTWDRSRTWLFMRTSSGLELRHDHRHEDGTPDEVTMYGGTTADDGTANRQEFILADRRADDGSLLGWRVEIEPGVRYTYGTIRGGEWTWRVDFDLSGTVAAPPAPWGHR
jgi:hypothetical protein